MPLYDLKCRSCGNEILDELMKVDEVKLCPICDAEMEHMPTSGSFVFTPPGITTHRHKFGNKVPEGYKTKGGANFGRIK